MKKYLVILFGLISINSFSYTVLSEDNYFKGFFTSSSTIEIMKDSFDYYKDLAVTSDRLSNVEQARKDSLEGMEKLIKKVVENKLISLLEGTNLSGKDFDSKAMYKFADEITTKLLSNNNIIKTAKIVEVIEGNNKKYLLLTVSNKKEIENEVTKEFKVRLKNVIYRLNDYYHELGE